MRPRLVLTELFIVRPPLKKFNRTAELNSIGFFLLFKPSWSPGQERSGRWLNAEIAPRISLSPVVLDVMLTTCFKEERDAFAPNLNLPVKLNACV